MNKAMLFTNTVLLIILCFFQFSAAAELKHSPFAIDANTKRIIEKYVVQKGDTLSEIGYKYNVLVKELIHFNNLRSQMVYISQELLIPLKPLSKGSIDNGNKADILEIIRRGDKYRNQQQYEKAIEVYREALELDPNNIDAYYGIGYSNLKMGLNDKSIESFMKAVRIDPYNPESHYNLGIVYFLIKKKGPAFEQYKILEVLNEKYATRLLMYIDSLR